MVAIWQWLVANGLLRDLLSAAILVPIMRFMGSGIAKRIAREVIKAAKEAEREVIATAHDAQRELDNVR